MGGMPELPDGPVTIMFTDIEASTALRTTLGDADADALFARHDAIVRERIAANRGSDQGAALGDGFLAVFTSTRRALTCAIEIQSALDAFNRTNPGPPLKVRIGLNTGEVAWSEGQLSGEAVHAASRVCGAASGGEILVSDVTRQLAGTVPDVTFRDAGEFQLKGFPRPWRLWEIVWVRETSAVTERVFVGRDDELAHLRAKLHDALNGHGGLVLVGGEPGVGKTTLVRQLIGEAERRGALALFGRCYESEGSIPYVPFVEMLEQALALMPADIVREDMGDDAPEVARMVPELRRRFPDIGEPLDLPPEQQRRYFFNAVGSFVARGSGRFPLLLVIDDIHWADEPTLLLTEHMASIMPDLRVLGVGTYRDVELDVSRPLATTVERLTRARLVERLPVKRFDRTTVATMIEALAGTPPPDVVVDAIFAETEGNPFFVEEVYRHLVEEGKLFEDGAFRTDLAVDDLDVPESVRLVVGRRLERLGPDAQRILAAGAVVGRAFPFRLLEEITDADAGTLLDVVEAAEAAHVIVGDERGGEVDYSFGHELIRQTLLAGLSVVRRQRLHLAVADAIERLDPRARELRPSEIAAHLVQAGAAADRGRTLEYLERTADRAFDAAAYEEACRAVDDAIAVADPADGVRVAKLHERRGLAMRALGDFDGAIRTWNEVIDAYTDHGLNDEAAGLCAAVGYQLAWLNRFEEGFNTYARGLTLIGDAATPARARLLGLTGGIGGLAGFYDMADPQLAEAEAVAREIGDERALGNVLWARCMADWTNCRPQSAIAAGRAAIELLRGANDLWSLVDAMAWASYPLITSGQPDQLQEGIRFANEARDLARRLGHRGGECLGVRGTVMSRHLTEISRTSEIEKGADEDLAAFSSIHSPWRSQSYALLTTARILTGDLDGAVAAASRAIELEPVSAWSGVGSGSLFLAHAWRGDTETCRRLLDELRVAFPVPGEIPTIGPLVMTWTAVEALAVLGWTDELAALHPVLAGLGEVDHVHGFDGSLRERVTAMTAAAAEQWDEADALFDAALARAGALDLRVEPGRLRLWRAETLLRRGRPGDARDAAELLDHALDDMNRLEMPLYAERARSLRARVGA